MAGTKEGLWGSRWTRADVDELVSASDKLHNVRAILMDYREEGERLWSRFNAGKQGALWYYRALVNAFSGKRIQPLVQELNRTLTQLELLSIMERK